MKLRLVLFIIFLLLIGQEQCNDKETNIKQSKEEKKIEIDPNVVIPEAPEFPRCGTDDLNIKPIEISTENIVPKKEEINKNKNK